MSTTRITQTFPDQPLIPVLAAFSHLGISRSTGYELLRTGEFPLPVVKVGKRTKVRRVDLARYLGVTVGGDAV
ncbi:helix-turn-helix domain-containing protein [Spongisporangium articulatum]|uniref:Helix-turn-helix domain-containing protein n=1 Tax=Spongisporangium articulatum TaxID=3362603 RepID=A0ABW8ANC4_9ACTN